MIKQTATDYETALDCLNEAVRVLARSPGPLLERLEDCYLDALRLVDLTQVPQPQRVSLGSIVATLRALSTGGDKTAEIREVLQGDASVQVVDEIIAIRDALLKIEIRQLEAANAKAAHHPPRGRQSAV
ncbi:MAG: hypothetical protein NXI16_09860 [Alphaproteobacteria bacterium]|nr:hypothetical protein [Alphaproteobacteria bacterium]